MSANCGRHCAVWYPVNLSADQIKHTRTENHYNCLPLPLFCACCTCNARRQAHTLLSHLSFPPSVCQLAARLSFLLPLLPPSFFPSLSPCVPNSPLCTRALLLRILLSLTGVLIFFSSSTSFHLGFPLPSAALPPPVSLRTLVFTVPRGFLI